jgi:hypothetical protein
MKIVVISDPHGNFDALFALPEPGDELCWMWKSSSTPTRTTRKQNRQRGKREDF